MGKFKVVYTDNIYKDNEIEYRRFAEAGYDFFVASSHDKETLKKECADADAVMLSFIEMDEELINSRSSSAAAWASTTSTFLPLQSVELWSLTFKNTALMRFLITLLP